MATLLTRRALLRGALGTAALPFGPAMSAPADVQDTGSRIALVIGNGAYRTAPLKNPPGDAVAVAAVLRDLGYAVTLRQNTRLPELIESLREFSIRAPKAAVRVVFYAGHGVQVKGRNYLVPIDADPQSEEEIQRQSADVGEFVDRLSAIGRGANIVVLDACRVNPFAGGVIVGPDGRRLKFRGATPGGLASLDAPVGTLVAFSTAPNGVALDSAGSEHSVYARHLLANMAMPGLQIEQLFKRVRIGVAEDTGRVQVPWESSSLTADFCFKSDANGRCGS
ncbi:caspase family protein [Variovorax sp. YR216]|uniref:caspase family protein n=1 Tax=Variovorax sp. YR216 TaxID=1882828 RepID=UPI0008954233|nr:caspase family protein [Variovorax sp. YR216]SEB09694.1 Caspase domain-containing protein [Variovorax sp. YR216]